MPAARHVVVSTLLLSAIFAVCANVAGQVPPGSPAPLTLAELEQMALAHNPTLVQAARRVAALQGKYVQVGLLPNPSVGYVGEEIGDEGRAGLQGAGFSQQIVTGGKLRLNRAVVSQEIARARQDWEIQRRRVVGDVRAAAYDVLAAERTRALSEQLVRIGTEAEEVAEELLKAQEVSRVDVLQARIEANTARVLLSNARNAYRAAWRRLASVAGVPDLAPAPIQDRLEEGPAELEWEASLGRLLAGSPELARAYADVERARCGLARELAGRKPDVDLEAAVLYNHGPEDTVASVGVAVPLKLFDRNQGNIARAQAELGAAQQEVRRVELSLRERLAAEFRRYADARQEAARYRQAILPDAKDSLELVREAYRQGEFDYLKLLTAQRTFFRVNLAYVDALRDLWLSSTRIEGMLLGGGLEAPGR